MPDNKKITELPPSIAAAGAVVPASTSDGSQTVKVTLGDIAALGGGVPGEHFHTVQEINNLTTILSQKVEAGHQHYVEDILNFPAQSASNAGQYLYTDGIRLRWGTVQTTGQGNTTGAVNSVNGQTGAVSINVPVKTTETSELTDFPSQTGNTGLYLQTDGTSMTWASASGSSAGVDSINSQTGAVTLSAGDVGAATASHVHTISNITGLVNALSNKSNTGHTHQFENISNFPDAGASSVGKYLTVSAASTLSFADAPIKSDTSQAGAGSVSITNIVRISAASYTSLQSANSVDPHTLYIIT